MQNGTAGIVTFFLPQKSLDPHRVACTARDMNGNVVSDAATQATADAFGTISPSADMLIGFMSIGAAFQEPKVVVTATFDKPAKFGCVLGGGGHIEEAMF